MNQPQLIAIAGPNGAGKSTVTQRFRDNNLLPKKYINPDEIVLNMTEIVDPTERIYAAAREADRQRQELLIARESMAFETVMSHPSKIEFMRSARTAGYRVTLIFVGVASSKISILRVKQRVTNGGHDVPRQKIIERYDRVMLLLPQAIQAVDRALLFDNSDDLQAARLVAEFRDGKQVFGVTDAPQWAIHQ